MSDYKPDSKLVEVYKREAIMFGVFVFVVAVIIFLIWVYCKLKSAPDVPVVQYHRLPVSDGSIDREIDEPPPVYSDDYPPQERVSEDEYDSPPAYPEDETGAPPPYMEPDLPPKYPGIFDVPETRCEITDDWNVKFRTGN